MGSWNGVTARIAAGLCALRTWAVAMGLLCRWAGWRWMQALGLTLGIGHVAYPGNALRSPVNVARDTARIVYIIHIVRTS